MLKGKTITLRPVRDTDLDQLYAYHLDIDNRGDFFPRTILPQPLFRKQFQESGFWEHGDLFWAVRGGGGNFGVVTVPVLSWHKRKL
jgi:hypothetical protein